MVFKNVDLKEIRLDITFSNALIVPGDVAINTRFHNLTHIRKMRLRTLITMDERYHLDIRRQTDRFRMTFVH